jgi:hypothetical protein
MLGPIELAQLIHDGTHELLLLLLQVASTSRPCAPSTLRGTGRRCSVLVNSGGNLGNFEKSMFGEVSSPLVSGSSTAAAAVSSGAWQVLNAYYANLTCLFALLFRTLVLETPPLARLAATLERRLL